MRSKYPAAYQHLLERAKPERDQNRNAVFRERWWVIGHPRQQFRKATAGLTRYIATIETSKHRFFAFLPTAVTPDSTLVTIATADAYALGLLSSIVHEAWALAAGGSLEDRPRYNKTTCFEPYPFPIATDDQQACLRILAEQLDAHRKRQQAAHPDLTLTGMYNVLDKLRSGEPLTAKERSIHEHGLVSVLRQLHDEIDAAVLDAYGWSDLLPLLRIGHGNDAPAPVGAASAAMLSAIGNAPPLADESSTATDKGIAAEAAPTHAFGRDDAKRTFDEAILERLVALNAERAAEEARGLIRWLRPEFQHPSAQLAPTQGELPDARDDDLAAAPGNLAAAKPLPWPKDAVAQVRAVADALSASPVPLSLDDIAARFTARGPWKKRLPQLLDMLVALGRAREQDGRYTG